MLDKIIPKLLREYMDTDDPARRAELVQVLQDYGAFPRIFEVCDQALSQKAGATEAEPQIDERAARADAPVRRNRSKPTRTSDYFVANVE